MKVLLIYNPNAGNRTFKNNLDGILEKLQEKGYLVTLYRINEHCDLHDLLGKIDPAEYNEAEMYPASLKRTDARKFSTAENFLRMRYKKILVAGGDGTIHHVVNALMKRGIDLPIGIYPVGTANDFAQNFNLPPSIEEITDIFTRENYTHCDLGMVNGKYFINVASLGCLVDISQRTDQKAKNSFGVFSYYLKGIEEFQRLRTIKIKVTSEDFTFEDHIYFMLIMNGKSAGGFKKIAPLSVINDGLLDVYIFKKCPILELMGLVAKILKGEHAQNPNVLYFQTSKLTVDCKDKVMTDLDGERGAAFPLEIQVAPNQLKINTLYNHEDGFDSLREFSFHDVKKAAEQISNGMINEIKRPFKEFKIEKNSVTELMKLAIDLPRHDALNYINKGSLNSDYFKAAENTLDNGYLYIVLSSTGSAAGELIRKVTKKEYSHASLSFDADLETIISYNGGENIYAPGLNQEMIEFFHKKEDANIIIYKIKATKEQKKRALEEVLKINRLGSSYNLLGLFFPYSHRENIMFCSQFVYTILKIAGINYFEKKPEEVKPTDFVELDYKRYLEFHSQIFLKEYISELT